MHPALPRFGGASDSGEYFPLPLTLIRKTPLPVFLICKVLTGPCSPFESLYLKPFVRSPLQKVLPLRPVAWGRRNVCDEGLSPSARTVSVAPSTVGSPTIVFGLVISFALPTKLRWSGVLGSLTSSWLPRIC
jgi:hypothetical protein